MRKYLAHVFENIPANVHKNEFLLPAFIIYYLFVLFVYHLIIGNITGNITGNYQ